jgi:hypothetical protein
LATVAARDTAATALASALDGLSIGAVQSEQIVDKTILGNSAASDPTAQRELKLSVAFYDTVTFDAYTVEVPILGQANVQFAGQDSDEIVINDGGNMQAFQSAFETNCVSKNGNPVLITKAFLVGRNL